MPQQSNYRRQQGRRDHRQQHQGNPIGTIEFLDGKGKLKADLFDTQANEAAKSVADCKRETNKSTQLRKFFDELVMWHDRVQQSPEKFDDFAPLIRMIKAKVAYARGRKLVDSNFEKLLGQIVDHAATSAESLGQAKLFFEAFMGFYKQAKGD